MTALAANYSNALVELFAAGNPPVDMVEVGPWFNLAQISAHMETLAKVPFLFHGSRSLGLIDRLPWVLRKQRQYLDITNSPWASIHLALLPLPAFKFYRRFGLRMPRPSAAWAIKGVIENANRLQTDMGRPVLLENMPGLPLRGYMTEIEPTRITQIIKDTGYNLLLDVAHARVAAAGLGIDIYEYLKALPLEKAVEVHTSGPRRVNGYLSDAHEPMQAIDYEILAWVLHNTRPRLVTLEYIRDKEALDEQLRRLRQMITTAGPGENGGDGIRKL